MNVYEAICGLTQYGITTGLIPESERIYTINQLLDVMKLDEYEEPGQIPEAGLEALLKVLLDDAAQRGVIEDSIVYRDLFDTRLMNCLVPRPAQVTARFHAEYEKSPEAATSWYYKFSQDTDYIRRYRVSRDLKWVTPTQYGDLDITINLSKPEKDPKAIAAAKLMKQSGYPKCLLCRENEGYAGRVNHPARNTHRIIPLELGGSAWGLQYSPYVYYNEHCIVFCQSHVPMKIDRGTFVRLLDFVTQFPHYFLGSNADLPIVGGSILTHDHFQGGHYTFAMERAQVETELHISGYEDVYAGIVKWPMSVIRIRHKERERLVQLACRILDSWRNYTDRERFIFAETDGEPHNTITPIARRRNGEYELDLVLRNNITTPEHPLGVYHPHQELHHIKKENIGLIEVMGLAVLPSRLKDELSGLKDAILTGRDIRQDAVLSKHANWTQELLQRHSDITQDNLDDILQYEVGKVFERVLEDAGVFKRTPEGMAAFMRFVEQL